MDDKKMYKILILGFGLFFLTSCTHVSTSGIEKIKLENFDFYFLKYEKRERSKLLRVDYTEKQAVLLRYLEGNKSLSGIEIFNRGSLAPNFSLSDTNEDGKYDSFSYIIQNDKGDDLLMFTDSNCDGQADTKIDFVNNKGYAFVKGKWFEVLIDNGKRKVLMNDKPQRIQLINGEWIIDKDNDQGKGTTGDVFKGNLWERP